MESEERRRSIWTQRTIAFQFDEYVFREVKEQGVAIVEQGDDVRGGNSNSDGEGNGASD